MNKKDNQMAVLNKYLSGDMTDEDIINCNNAGFTSVELEQKMCSNCKRVARCNELEWEV